MKWILQSIVVFALAVVLSYAIAYQWPPAGKNPDPNHTHADFALWADGKQIDFSKLEFMSKELTSAEEEALKHETGNEAIPDPAGLRKYLHLHDGNGYVIHRHKPGLPLCDFFNSLNSLKGTDPSRFGFMGNDMSFTYQGKQHYFRRLFINGVEEIQDVGCSYVFKDGDHLLLTDAKIDDDAEIRHELSLMTDDACTYSKTCPWRGEPPVETCISDPTIPCRE